MSGKDRCDECDGEIETRHVDGEAVLAGLFTDREIRVDKCEDCRRSWVEGKLVYEGDNLRTDGGTQESDSDRCDHPECEEDLESPSEDVDSNWCSLECFTDAKGIDLGDDDVVCYPGTEGDAHV